MVAEAAEQLKHLAPAQTLKAKLALRIADKDAQAARDDLERWTSRGA